MYAVLWLVTDDDYYVRKVVAEDIFQSKKASLLQFESFLDNLCKSGKMHVISKLQHKLVSMINYAGFLAPSYAFQAFV